jgi:DNA polymerase-3 subunit epsilon
MLVQRSFEDLGTPLAEVTFCILDLETTGGSPSECSITEVGAITVRGGETVGTFQTLVNPGSPVPAFIRLLTGISNDMLVEAPEIASVLPSLLEFTKGCVLVAHNARFDVSFVNAALEKHGYERLDNRVVDTARLAAKILHGEVPNNRLATLARALRLPHRPCHRAFADVLATTDLLHLLIERATGFGVTTLEDLLALSSTRMDGTFSKIKLCEGLPAKKGVYRFIGGQGQTLYVGKAADLRARVRSYFYGDPRRKIRDLLRQVERIEIDEYQSMLEAEVAEARAIARELPPHNRAGKKQGTWFVKVATGRSPKVATARVVKRDDAVYLGPFSPRICKTLIEGLRDALPIHRCSEPRRCAGCAFSEMRRCPGGMTDEHREQIRSVARAITCDPRVVLDPLRDRMYELARAERYEQAADVREKGALLERALTRSIESESLRAAGRIELEVDGRRLTIENGRLCMGPDGADETDVRVICAWLRKGAENARMLSVEGTWALPIAARPTTYFKPVAKS